MAGVNWALTGRVVDPLDLDDIGSGKVLGYKSFDVAGTHAIHPAQVDFFWGQLFFVTGCPYFCGGGARGFNLHHLVTASVPVHVSGSLGLIVVVHEDVIVTVVDLDVWLSHCLWGRGLSEEICHGGVSEP